MRQRRHDKQLRASLHGFPHQSRWFLQTEHQARPSLALQSKKGRPSQHPLRKILMKSKPVQAHAALNCSPFVLGALCQLLGSPRSMHCASKQLAQNECHSVAHHVNTINVLKLDLDRMLGSEFSSPESIKHIDWTNGPSHALGTSPSDRWRNRPRDRK